MNQKKKVCILKSFQISIFKNYQIYRYLIIGDIHKGL